jgi:hypothetical protein
MVRADRSSAHAGTAAKPGLSIRGRLLVLAALAIAPLLVDRIRLLETERVDRVAAASQEAISLARRSVEAQQQIVLAAHSVLQVVSHGYAAASPEACDRLVAQIADVPRIKTLQFVGHDGRIACSNFPDAVGLDLSDRWHFRQVLSTGAFVSDYAFGRLQRAPTIVATLPVRGPDNVIAGVISAGIDLAWVEGLRRA